MRTVAEIANVSYEYVYQTALGFYIENKKGDLETIKKLQMCFNFLYSIKYHFFIKPYCT
jgi:hypothetical protein